MCSASKRACIWHRQTKGDRMYMIACIWHTQTTSDTHSRTSDTHSRSTAVPFFWLEFLCLEEKMTFSFYKQKAIPIDDGVVIKDIKRRRAQPHVHAPPIACPRSGLVSYLSTTKAKAWPRWTNAPSTTFCNCVCGCVCGWATLLPRFLPHFL